VVAALWMVRTEGHSNSSALAVKQKSAIWRDIAEGLRYVRNRPRVSSLLLLAAVNSLFGAPYFTLVPIYARDIFHLGETGLALMMGAAGGGAFFSALLVAYLGDFRRKGWFVLGGAIVFGLCITGFALSNRLVVSLLFLFGLGFALVMSVAISNTLLQKLVTDEMRGRVMSMFILSFMGTIPIGNIAAGTASTHFGPQHTLAVGGLVVTVVATTVSIFSRRLRELY
jgi:predicted MFS family arabinose efflux permease